MSLSKSLQNQLKYISKIAFICAFIGAAITAWGFFADQKTFAISYLNNFVFWLGITLGCFPLIMLHHLTSGEWALPIRRFLEIALKNIPLLAILFLPIIPQIEILYMWADPELMSHDTLLQHKAPYLNIPFFLARIAIYFGIWFILAFFLNKWALEYDANVTKKGLTKLQGLSGGGLILYSLTVTFAITDLIMSLEPHWFSTIYGVIFMAGFALLTLSGGLVLVNCLRHETPWNKTFTTERCAHLSSLMFGFVLLLAYLSVSQFIIIWSGNLQEEAPWYLNRGENNWQSLTLLIIFLQFVLPFLALLAGSIRRNMSVVLKIAGLILIMRWVEIYWYVQPAFYDEVHFHLSDFITFLTIGALWIGIFFQNVAKDQTLTYKQDPVNQG